MRRLRERLGGPAGNERLTAATAVVLLALIAVELVTLLSLSLMLRVHMFVGILLTAPVALKLGSTGWRFLRYYRRDPAYVAKGPPHIVMRLLAPLLVASTATLLSSGIAAVFSGPRVRWLIGLHKLAFVVWLGALGLHVLVYVWRLPRLLRVELSAQALVAGRTVRVAAIVGTVVVGAWIADETLPWDDRWIVAARALGIG
jgi:hypothetical protein